MKCCEEVFYTITTIATEKLPQDVFPSEVFQPGKLGAEDLAEESSLGYEQSVEYSLTKAM